MGAKQRATAVGSMKGSMLARVYSMLFVLSLTLRMRTVSGYTLGKDGQFDTIDHHMQYQRIQCTK